MPPGDLAIKPKSDTSLAATTEFPAATVPVADPSEFQGATAGLCAHLAATAGPWARMAVITCKSYDEVRKAIDEKSEDDVFAAIEE